MEGYRWSCGRKSTSNGNNMVWFSSKLFFHSLYVLFKGLLKSSGPRTTTLEARTEAIPKKYSVQMKRQIVWRTKRLRSGNGNMI
jgi:hypothetical protein